MLTEKKITDETRYFYFKEFKEEIDKDFTVLDLIPSEVMRDYLKSINYQFSDLEEYCLIDSLSAVSTLVTRHYLYNKIKERTAKKSIKKLIEQREFTDVTIMQKFMKFNPNYTYIVHEVSPDLNLKNPGKYLTSFTSKNIMKRLRGIHGNPNTPLLKYEQVEFMDPEYIKPKLVIERSKDDRCNDEEELEELNEYIGEIHLVLNQNLQPIDIYYVDFMTFDDLNTSLSNVLLDRHEEFDNLSKYPNPFEVGDKVKLVNYGWDPGEITITSVKKPKFSSKTRYENYIKGEFYLKGERFEMDFNPLFLEYCNFFN